MYIATNVHKKRLPYTEAVFKLIYFYPYKIETTFKPTVKIVGFPGIPLIMCKQKNREPLYKEIPCFLLPYGKSLLQNVRCNVPLSWVAALVGFIQTTRFREYPN